MYAFVNRFRNLEQRQKNVAISREDFWFSSFSALLCDLGVSVLGLNAESRRTPSTHHSRAQHGEQSEYLPSTLDCLRFSMSQIDRIFRSLKPLTDAPI